MPLGKVALDRRGLVSMSDLPLAIRTTCGSGLTSFMLFTRLRITDRRATSHRKRYTVAIIRNGRWRRSTAPIEPMPTISIAQLAGSGTAEPLKRTSERPDPVSFAS